MPKHPELIATFSSMNLIEQDILLDDLTALHNQSKEKRRAELRAELGSLVDRPLKDKPMKASVKYRSLKNPSLGWAGRGAQPHWLVEEMKESGKALDAFRA